MSQEQQHEFDIVGHPRAGFSFVVVFPFHPSSDGSPGGEVRPEIAPVMVCLLQKLQKNLMVVHLAAAGDLAAVV